MSNRRCRGRQLWVREQLARFIEQYGYEPTALELLRFVAAGFDHPSQCDVNTVRPRLTELHDQGWVARADKRTCTVSNVRVYTWRLATPRPPEPYREPIAQRLFV